MTPNSDHHLKTSMRPVTFVITFLLKPDDIGEFENLLGQVLDAMRAETTFINAVLHRDADQPEKFMLYETWADLDDVLDVQIHRPYRQTYWNRLPSLVVETQKIETWYPVRTDIAKAAVESRASGYTG